MSWLADGLVELGLKSGFLLKENDDRGIDLISVTDLSDGKAWKNLVQQMKKYIHGFAYIINNSQFKCGRNLCERKGSEVDVKMMVEALTELSMSVEVAQDMTKKEFQALGKEIGSKDFGDVSCLIIVIMSHGFENNVIAAQDTNIMLFDDFLCPIYLNQSLISKLVLIITERCRGSVNPLYTESYGPKIETLQIHSASEGYQAIMNTQTGSLLIKSVYRALKNYGLEKSVSEIAELIQKDKENEDFKVEILSNLIEHKDHVLGLPDSDTLV